MELCPDCKMPNPWFDPATGPEAPSNLFAFEGLLDDSKTERNLMLFAAASGMMCIVLLLTGSVESWSQLPVMDRVARVGFPILSAGSMALLFRSNLLQERAWRRVARLILITGVLLTLAWSALS